MSITLGPLTLHAYGFLLALAVFTATFLTARAVRQANDKRLDPEVVWDGLFWVLVFGIIGARLYHVIHLWDFYSSDPKLIYQIWFGGMAIWGAMIGGLAGAILFARIRRIAWGDFLAYLNLAAPYIALGQAIGRIGNIVNGELLPFAYYEAAFDFAIFLVLLFLAGLKVEGGRWKVVFEGRRWKIDFKKFYPLPSIFKIHHQPSTLDLQFPLYLVLYGSGRFFLEFTRTDEIWRITLPTLGGVAVAQIFGVLAFALGLMLLLTRFKWQSLP